MRRFLILLLLLGTIAPVLAQAPACTGLCLQQVSCPTGGTTSISGTVYAPNGLDPLPNVTVFIPNAAVTAFTPGVQCLPPGAPPSGSPLVGTSTAADGTFKLVNVPVGTNIPVVIQAGRWRRQFTVSTTTACADTAFSGRMPKNQTEGDIPLIAIPTGSADSIECLLRKVGVDDAEFTNPLSTGRIHLYAGSFSKGAITDANTPSQTTLMDSPAQLAKYDVLMLPCQGGPNSQTTTARLSNLLNYANSGGRIYASHYSQTWFAKNGDFASVAAWPASGTGAGGTGTATINTKFTGGKTLSDWLTAIGATTTPGQVQLTQIVADIPSVTSASQAWLTLNGSSAIEQFTFNAPVNSTNQCGRVLFNEYHVEVPTIPSAGKIFPAECGTGAMTNQEKLLEYSLFDLTNTGGQPTLAPTSADFGKQALGFTSANKVFTWTNNSIFAAAVSSVTASGDFLATGNGCSNVASGASCQINVVYRPTALGAASGTLTVVSNAATLTADLTGTGVPALAIAPTSLTFGSTDVGATATQSFAVSNVAGAAVSLGTIAITGDYKATTTCPASIPAGTTCSVAIGFTPTTTGTRPGTAVVNGSTVTLTGNGVDFTVAVDPASGSVIAGLGTVTPITVLPVAGFSNVVTVTCTTNAPASTCVPTKASFVPSDTASAKLTITTTARYTVVGYGGFGGRGILLAAAVGSGFLLLLAGRRHRGVRLAAATLALLATGSLASGCSGKLPDANATYTPAGSYTYTVTATDGFLKHSATYTLAVSAK